MSGDSGGSSRTGGARTSTAEWVTAALGALVVLFTLGYLGYDAVTQPSQPADVIVRPGAVSRASGRYILKFTAHNEGGATAARVQIVAELLQGDSVVEQHQATLQYVPPRSEREGGFFFNHDPREGRLQLRAEGYSAP